MAHAALRAIGTLGHTQLAHHLLLALADKQRWQPAADSLVALGAAAAPLLRKALHDRHRPAPTHRLVTVLERIDAPSSRAALVEPGPGP
ncbi:hypothetical protein ACFQT0_06940 [Hymenobacter humi]|uniref:HEAT repeat domain-containing protein n=1 Tax=Hymenobacter humi TaxID=1411620 RepID=A0ABW2U2K9_9BACT